MTIILRYDSLPLNWFKFERDDTILSVYVFVYVHMYEEVCIHTHWYMHVEARAWCWVFPFIARYISFWDRSLTQTEQLGSTPQAWFLLRSPGRRACHYVWLLCGCRISCLGLQVHTACTLLTESQHPGPAFAFLKRMLTFVFFSTVVLLWESTKRSALRWTQLLFPLSLSLALCI